MHLIIASLLGLLVIGSALAAEIPEGLYSNQECITCHEKETPDLVTDWRAGPHSDDAKAVGCVSCHGQQHPNSMEMARKNRTCVDCHGGEKSTISRSYFTSKHGVIARIEASRWDWTKPLAEANYRAPTCAYCHVHEGGHGMAAKDEAVEAACADCHAPRYAGTMFEAGKRTLEIGALKVQEAQSAIGSLIESESVSAADTKPLKLMLSHMREKSLTSLRLGLGHHSPDYQWWYGQAALDGDLLRIKALITHYKRTNSP